MVSPSRTSSTNTDESLDLAALGKTWTPPQELDTSPEVSDVIAEMPWWAARGLLHVIIGFLIVALVWARPARLVCPLLQRLGRS